MLFLHSSYQGVHICGTITLEGNEDSKAYKLAKEYMGKYYNNYYLRYPIVRGVDYLTEYNQMRWRTLEDPDGYNNMAPEEILKDLFDKK